MLVPLVTANADPGSAHPRSAQPSDAPIRIDYVQHAPCAMIQYYVLPRDGLHDRK